MRTRQTTRIANIARFGKAAFLTALFLAAVPLFAHHSIPAYFYTDQKNTIEGNVASFDYRNPHAFLHVEVEDAKSGQRQLWDVEWSSIRRLENQGVTKDTLKPGDHVKIVAYPSRKANDHVLHLSLIHI